MASVRYPHIVNAANIFIGGIGNLGVSDSATFPSLEFDADEHKGGIGTRYIDKGTLMAMTATFKLSRVNTTIYSMMGVIGASQPIITKSNLKDGSNNTLRIDTVYGIVSIKPDPHNIGDKVGVEISVKVNKYLLEIDSVPYAIIDTDNLICMIGGKDYYAALRANIS